MSEQPISLDASKRIDEFVVELDTPTREATAEWIRIPNIPDCQPEVLRYILKHGKEKGVEADERVEALRQELGLDYNTLQAELQARFR